MTPSLPTGAPAKVPATSAWLLLAAVLTTLLAVGRWTQQPAAAVLADQLTPARPAPAPRRVALVRPARPAAGFNAAVVSAAL